MINLESSQAQPVREEKRYCEYCNSTGIKQITKEQFFQWAAEQDWDYQKGESRLAAMRLAVEEYRRTGGIPCPYCESRGSWIERR